MKTKTFKDPQMQKLYDAMLVAAADKSSELYHKGEPRRGAGHRAAFWDGFSGKFTLNGPSRSANVIPGTFSAACFHAGAEWAKRIAAAEKAASPRGGTGRNQGRRPSAPGTTMKQRAIRMSDQEWEDAKYIGTDAIRAWVTQQAKELRALPTHILDLLRETTEARDAYQLARPLKRTVLEVGQVLHDMELQGLIVSDELPGTTNDLGRSFRPAPGV